MARIYNNGGRRIPAVGVTGRVTEQQILLLGEGTSRSSGFQKQTEKERGREEEYFWVLGAERGL